MGAECALRKKGYPMKRNAFTLIELLTVIAIIAILAGIIFPVFNAVRRNAKNSACQTNMAQIHQALKLYYNDYQAYPGLLFGYVERYSSGNAVIPIEKATNAALYKDKISTVTGFHCPFNIGPGEKLDTIVTGVVYPAVRVFNNGNWNTVVNQSVAGQVVVNPFTNKNAEFYLYDSYDFGPATPKDDPNPKFELHYMLFWTDDGLSGGSQNDDERQLGYRHPDESAVVTWCSYGRNYSGATPTRDKTDNVLFLNGQVKAVDSLNMAQRAFGQSATAP